jgi:hypothetical protein
MLFDDQVLWFGQDVLGLTNIRELDSLKYNPKHIMILFKAILYHWSQQHRIDIESLGKLCIVASMPPNLYANKTLHNKALSAYSKAFNTTKPIYLRTSDTTHRIATKFVALKREAISYIEVNQSRLPGYTLLIDLGYGTIDSGLFKNGCATPLTINTQNNGLIHAYAEIDSINPDAIELNIMRGNSIQQIKPYLSNVKNSIIRVHRLLQSEGGLSNLILIGGATRLMDSNYKKSLRDIAPNLIVKDEFENARSNLKFAIKESI